MVKTSRQRLLEYIQSHNAATVDDLSRALKMTQANARHHLHILMDQGLVEVVGKRPALGRGRPSRVYAISNRSEGAGLEALLGALLSVGSEMEILQDAARQLAASTPEEDKKQASSMSSRLVAAVDRLNELGYRARWEAHAEGPHVILGRCPYSSILEEHPELCRMDAALLSGLLDRPVVQRVKLESDRSGLPFCLFGLR